MRRWRQEEKQIIPNTWAQLNPPKGGSLFLVCTKALAGSSSSPVRKRWDSGDFSGGPVVENPPSNAGDVGSIPGRGTKIPYAAGQLLSLRTATKDPTCVDKDPTCRDEDPACCN